LPFHPPASPSTAPSSSASPRSAATHKTSIWAPQPAFTEMMTPLFFSLFLHHLQQLPWHWQVHIDLGETYRPAGTSRPRRLLGRRDATIWWRSQQAGRSALI
jgi:hypothetical protein